MSRLCAGTINRHSNEQTQYTTHCARKKSNEKEGERLRRAATEEGRKSNSGDGLIDERTCCMLGAISKYATGSQGRGSRFSSCTLAKYAACFSAVQSLYCAVLPKSAGSLARNRRPFLRGLGNWSFGVLKQRSGSEGGDGLQSVLSYARRLQS